MFFRDLRVRENLQGLLITNDPRDLLTSTQQVNITHISRRIR